MPAVSVPFEFLLLKSLHLGRDIQTFSGSGSPLLAGLGYKELLHR